MKDITIEEFADISSEIHEAAARIGCTHLAVSGLIWPGGRSSGLPEEAARFVEYSWLQAAVVKGRAIFEEADPAAFAALLAQYGMGDVPILAPEPEAPCEVILADEPASTGKVELALEVLPATKAELERQARAEGLSVGEYLDWRFPPRPGR